MKTIQTKSDEILLVKVPEDTTWWEIIKNNMGEFITKTLNLNQMFLKYGKHSNIMGKSVPNIIYCAPKNFYLPKGNWVIVGKFSELEDNDLEEFVEKHPNIYYKDYMVDIISKAINGWTSNWAMLTAKESFDTLCKSQGIEDDLDNYLIIKKL
jgi:hypothetical protein